MNRSRSHKKATRSPVKSSSRVKTSSVGSSSSAISSLSASMARTSTRFSSTSSHAIKRQTATGALHNTRMSDISMNQPSKFSAFSPLSFFAKAYSTSSFASGTRSTLSTKQRAVSVPARTIVHDGKTDEELQKLVNDDKLVVIDWYADWCGPCRSFAPRFSQMSDKPEYKDVTFVRANIDDVQPPEGFPDVDSVPSFHIVKNKAVVHSFSGANEQRLTQAIEKYKD